MNYIEAMRLLSQAELGMILVSKDQYIIEANTAAEKLLGRPQPLQGQKFAEAVPELSSADTGDNYINIGFQKYLVRCACPEGIEIPEGCRMVCFKDISDGVFRDMMTSIINLIPEPMILADERQRVRLINNATMKMESLLPEDGVGLVHRMHVDPDLVRHLADRGKRLPLLQGRGRDPQDDLIAELLIDCLF